MPSPHTASPAARRLVASPVFALMHAADGACFVMQEAEPYAQYWLTERERLVFALFGRKGGAGVRGVVDALLILRAPRDAEAERGRIERAIAGMRGAGVLTEPDGELSRYGAAMARDYLEHRPFPRALAGRIIARAGIGEESRVLDLASGPGSLALQLAQACPNVSIMELSRGFCAAAQAEAAARGLRITAINESCNRLAQHEGSYHAITISQALHWLDQAQVCQGVSRNLAPGGRFFVIDAAISLPDAHPLSYILGDRTPLGDKSAVPFAVQAAERFRRLGQLFAGLGTVVGGVELGLYRQVRPIDEGFARAFLSRTHLAGLGTDAAAFWQDLALRCASAAPGAGMGVLEWSVMEFREGAPQDDLAGISAAPAQEIAFP